MPLLKITIMLIMSVIVGILCKKMNKFWKGVNGNVMDGNPSVLRVQVSDWTKD